MTIHAEDLPAATRKRLGIELQTKTGQAKRKRPGKGTTVCAIHCHTCDAFCGSEAAIEKHGQATGHARYEVKL